MVNDPSNLFAPPGGVSILRPLAGSIVFHSGGAEVFRIDPGGVLKAGPGLSPDEASQEMFAALQRAFPVLIASLKL